MIQFNRENPAIAAFNSQVQYGDRQRRVDEQDELARNQDIAERQAIAQFYANRPQQAPAPVESRQVPPVAAAAPAAAPALAPTPPMPAAQVPTVAMPTQGASMDFQMTRPGALAAGGGNQNLDFQMQRPAAAAPVAAPVAPPAGGPVTVQQPAPTGPVAAAAPTPPATPVGTRVNALRDGMGDVMSTMAKHPGAGSSMMKLFTTDVASQRTAAVEERRIQHEGVRMFMDASRANDIQLMRSISKQYGLGIPDEALNNREVMAKIAIGGTMAKQYGISDDMLALQFGKGYVEALAKGMDQHAALSAAYSAAIAAKGEGGDFKAKHWVVDNQGRVVAFDEGARSRVTDTVARPLKGAGGGGGGERLTATERNRANAETRLKQAFPEMDNAIIQQMVMNPRMMVTPQLHAQQVQALLRLKDNRGRAKYTPDQAQQMATQILQGARNFASSMPQVAPAAEPTPAPAAPGGAQQKPTTRAAPPGLQMYDPVTDRWSG